MRTRWRRRRARGAYFYTSFGRSEKKFVCLCEDGQQALIIFEPAALPYPIVRLEERGEYSMVAAVEAAVAVVLVEVAAAMVAAPS